MSNWFLYASTTGTLLHFVHRSDRFVYQLAVVSRLLDHYMRNFSAECPQQPGP